MLEGAGFAISETDRRMTQLIRFGVVEEVDYSKARAKVKIGENITTWLPWVTCAGAIKIWNPLKKGEQVVLLSNNGDFDQGVVLPSVYYNAFSSPSNNENTIEIQLSDNTCFTWNIKTNKMQLKLDTNGNINLTSGDQSLYFDQQEFTLTAPDTSFCFEEGGLTAQYLANQITLDLNGIHGKTEKAVVDVSKDSIQLKVSDDVHFSMTQDSIQASVGATSLVITRKGISINGRAL